MPRNYSNHLLLCIIATHSKKSGIESKLSLVTATGWIETPLKSDCTLNIVKTYRAREVLKVMTAETQIFKVNLQVEF